MKRKSFVAILLMVSLALGACGAKLDASVVVKVGETSASTGVFNYFYNTNLLYLNSLGFSTDDETIQAEVKKQTMSTIVEIAKIREICRAADKTPDTAEIDKAVEEEKAAFGSDEEFNKFLTEYKLSETDIRYIVESSYYNSLFNDMLTAELSGKITDDQAKAAYEADPKNYDLYKVSHILVAYPEKEDAAEPTEEEKAAVKAEAEALIVKLQGGADFATLAKENSDDEASATTGGAMDTEFTLTNSRFVDEFNDGIAELSKVGEFSATPVMSDFGAHIIKIDTLKTGFDTLKASILETMTSEARTKLYEEKTADKNFTVEYNKDFLAQEKIDM